MITVSTSEHLKRLGQAVFSIEEHCEDLLESMKLFEIAGNITATAYTPFSKPGMYCSNVYEHEMLEQKTIEPYLLNLSIFSMAWMGLESTINEMKILNPKLGKIGSLCSVLQLYSNVIVTPRGYKKCLSQWVIIENQFSNKYRSRKVIPSHVDMRGEAIFRVYSLRNHLFHGNSSCIVPSDPLWEVYIESLTLGTRIIAFTLQMLLMGYFFDKKFVSTWWHGSLQEYTEHICVERAFKFLHLEWI